MIQTVKNYKKLINEIPELISKADYKSNYFMKILGLTRPTYYRKLREKTFTTQEVELITKALFPKEAFLEEIKEDLKKAEQQIKKGEVVSHEEVMAHFEKKYL